MIAITRHSLLSIKRGVVLVVGTLILFSSAGIQVRLENLLPKIAAVKERIKLSSVSFLLLYDFGQCH